VSRHRSTIRVSLPAFLLAALSMTVVSGSATSAAPRVEVQLRLGVAPFDVQHSSAGPGNSRAAVPAIAPGQVASELVAALSARDEVEVVGPSALEGPTSEPTPREVRDLARSANVANIIVGRTRSGRIGTDVALVLRSGHSGAVVAEYEVREVQPAGLAGAMDGAATALLRDLGYEEPVAALPAVAAAAATADAAGPTAQAAAGLSAGKEEDGLIGELRSDEPISIESDELEFLNAEAQRHLVFSRNVRVVQGDVHLRTERLEAF